MESIAIRFGSVLVAGVVVALGACSAGGGGTPRQGSEIDPNQPPPGVFSPGNGGGGSFTPDVPTAECSADCQDFPAEPLFDEENAPRPPAEAPSLFGAPDNFGNAGACVREPQLSEETTGRRGALLPANWLEPRFRWEPVAGDDLFELRISAEKEAHDLVVYTRATEYILPREIWQGVAKNVHLEPLVVTLRGVNSASPATPSGTRGSFEVAPVNAGGSMVYWAATSSEVRPDTSLLYGFSVGEDNVVEALTIPDVAQTGILHENGRDLRGQHSDPKGVAPGRTQCIGCHVSTPDGAAVAFTDHWPWNMVFASVEEETTGAVPAYLTPGAQLLLNQPWLGMQTMSPAHWRDGDRVVVASYAARGTGVGFSDSPGQGTGQRLAWFAVDTPATFPDTNGDQTALNSAIQAAQGSAWGFLELQGETQNAATPDFSHDGQTLVYTSAGGVADGRLTSGGEYDVVRVPYDDRQGGPVTKVAGASEAGVAEYYPAFSSDDTLIAFNRVATTSGTLYYRPEGEIFVVPAEGGAAVRLDANDPPSCTGERSPGLINSWPKWSPRVQAVGGVEYFFLVFSSARDYPGTFRVPRNQYSPPDTRASQLYMAAITRDTATGQLTTYPAVYLWNQTPDTSNLTPAWDEFLIPAAPPRVR